MENTSVINIKIGTTLLMRTSTIYPLKFTNYKKANYYINNFAD